MCPRRIFDSCKSRQHKDTASQTHGSTNTRHRKHTLRRRSAVLLAMRKQAFCALRSATPVPRGVWTRRCCGEQSAAFANAKSSVFVAVAWDFWQISISTAKCRFRIARICRNGKIFVPLQRHFVPTFCGLPFPVSRVSRSRVYRPLDSSSPF